MCHPSLQLDGLRILIVDDYVDSLDLLTLVLEEYGIETICATSVREAIDRLHHLTPDLIISELFLPPEDGYVLLREIRALEAERHVRIPAIALTVYARNQDRVQALAAGFDRYLSKPFDLDELVRLIAQLMEQVNLPSARGGSMSRLLFDYCYKCGWSTPQHEGQRLK